MIDLSTCQFGDLLKTADGNYYGFNKHAPDQYNKNNYLLLDLTIKETVGYSKNGTKHDYMGLSTRDIVEVNPNPNTTLMKETQPEAPEGYTAEVSSLCLTPKDTTKRKIFLDIRYTPEGDPLIGIEAEVKIDNKLNDAYTLDEWDAINKAIEAIQEQAYARLFNRNGL
jgi:hypothetical protein